MGLDLLIREDTVLDGLGPGIAGSRVSTAELGPRLRGGDD
jgi:hypothetical protein